MLHTVADARSFDCQALARICGESRSVAAQFSLTVEGDRRKILQPHSANYRPSPTASIRSVAVWMCFHVLPPTVETKGGPREIATNRKERALETILFLHAVSPLLAIASACFSRARERALRKSPCRRAPLRQAVVW